MMTSNEQEVAPDSNLDTLLNTHLAGKIVRKDPTKLVFTQKTPPNNDIYNLTCTGNFNMVNLESST